MRSIIDFEPHVQAACTHSGVSRVADTLPSSCHFERNMFSIDGDRTARLTLPFRRFRVSFFPVWEPILCGDVVQPLITTAIMKFFLDF